MERKQIFKGTIGELKQIAKGHDMFELEILDTQEEVKKCIKEDEGKCIQQVCYSTYHDAFTQINFTKKIIRTNLKLKQD